jgi:hypothetical protein
MAISIRNTPLKNKLQNKQARGKENDIVMHASFSAAHSVNDFTRSHKEKKNQLMQQQNSLPFADGHAKHNCTSGTYHHILITDLRSKQTKAAKVETIQNLQELKSIEISPHNKIHPCHQRQESTHPQPNRKPRIQEATNPVSNIPE